MRLSDLVKRDLSVDPQIQGVTADSRKVRPGFLFAALPGAKVDGRSFAPRAVEQGAAAVLAGREIEGLPAPLVIASDPRRAYALAAAAFWGAQPATCVAVTGTNGKTSVAGFCRQMFARAGFKAASMGTLGVRISVPKTQEGGAEDEQITPPGLTTPDAADVAELLARVAQAGVTHLALEASSHGIDQRRLDGVKLTAAGFLNLTQDHLDYHGTMGVYRAAKLRLFETLLARGRTAVLNADSDAYPAFAGVAVSAGQGVM
ncbi:MAG: UDP-N-acetylmuramoyl-L-alanyl-D-glutamate--2,6-diaminopimelate ligase, partial [Phenylobacterium sp.]|nr:UDP-N-acetylmuramoyl-L-alanyl-D-glutamate--2,6-diaminopimelate ligase [Phenylobacterium sp.]